MKIQVGTLLGACAGVILFALIAVSVASYLDWVDPLPPPSGQLGFRPRQEGTQRTLWHGGSAGGLDMVVLIACILCGAAAGRSMARRHRGAQENGSGPSTGQS